MVHLVKRLVGEGCQCRIWDRNVVLGQLIGSNREFIENTIPHIGALLCDDLDQVLRFAEVILLGTRELDKGKIVAQLHSDQILVDLVSLRKPQSGEQDLMSVSLSEPVRD